MNIERKILFREVQRFSQIWVWILVLGVTALAWYGAVQQLILKIPFGNNPASDSLMLVIWLIFGIGFPLFFLSNKMITEVSEDGIYVRFLPIHRSFHKYAFKELKSYTVKSYSPVKDYGGWGIRFSAKGKAFNIKGNRGILLEFYNNKKLMIGSQRSEELATAIESAFSK